MEAGAAGKDDSVRRELSQLRLADLVERPDLAIDAGLAHPAGDQLRHLRAEIENENAIGHGTRRAVDEGGEGNGLAAPRKAASANVVQVLPAIGAFADLDAPLAVTALRHELTAEGLVEEARRIAFQDPDHRRRPAVATQAREHRSQ